MKSCLVNNNKLRVQKYGNSGYTVNKMVKTRNRQLRMIIYDKGKELRHQIEEIRQLLYAYRHGFIKEKTK